MYNQMHSTVCPRKNDPLHCFVIICITSGNFKAIFSTALHLLLIHILHSFRSCIVTSQILFAFFIICVRDFISKIFRTKDINRNLLENARAEKWPAIIQLSKLLKLWLLKSYVTREIQRTLQKIWNELPQKPLARTVQNFHKSLQVCVDKAGGHFEHFIWQTFHTTAVIVI